METEEFARFVARQQKTAVDTEIDWAGMRDEWLSNLDSLHRRIIDFLQEYITDGSITYSFAEITLSEENIGSYLAKRLDIKIGRQFVSFEPIGTLLIGCRGRVDAVGSTGRVPIFLVDKKAKSASDLITVTVSVTGGPPPTPPPQKEPTSWVWKIVGNSRGRMKFVDLDKESFVGLLMEIANA